MARGLGLAMVFTDQHSALDAAYLAFLQRAAAAAAEGAGGGTSSSGGGGAIAGGRFAEVGVFVQPQSPPPPQQPEAGAAASTAGTAGTAGTAAGPGSLTEGEGLIAVPVWASGEQLVAAVRRLGPLALATAQRRRQEAEARAALQRQVERKLQLRRLLVRVAAAGVVQMVAFHLWAYFWAVLLLWAEQVRPGCLQASA